jgi:hypothetical protein
MGNITYRATPRQARAWIIDCIQSGLVPFIKSSPGMGKSSIMKSIAKEFGLFVIDHRLSTSAPEDLSGLPEFYTDADGNRRARFVPFDIFPIAGQTPPEGYEGWMVFLDEANSGTKMVQAASYKLTLDKMVGQMHLHPNTALTMAGNLATDRAIVTSLSTAMQSRVIHINLELNFNEWLEDVALAHAWDDRIIAYLMWQEGQNTSALMDFRPDHDDETFCCPRTWEFMNNLVKGKEITDDKTGLYAGTITSGRAAEFVQFTHIYKELAKLEDILRDPLSVPVPEGQNRKWAVTSMLMNKTDTKNFDKLCQHISQYDLAFRALYFRGVLHQQPTLRQHPAFGPAIVDINKYLNG